MTAATASRSAPRLQALRQPAPQPAWKPQAAPVLAVEMAAQLSRQQEQRELLCSAIGLVVKVGLSLVAAVSLVKLAGAYQERMDRQGELQAVLNLQNGRLERVRLQFDHLFGVGGEQRLLGEQDQWIAPNRLRVVWLRSNNSIESGAEPAAEPSSQPQTLAAVNP